MAGHKGADGCGWIIAAPILLLLVLAAAVTALELAGMAMAAPVVVSYLAVTDPAALQTHLTAWLWGGAVAVVASIVLTSPPLRAGHQLDEPADRRARHVRRLQQAGLLLVTPGVAGLVLAAFGGVSTAPARLAESTETAGWAFVTAVVVTVCCGWWNRRFPAIGRLATVEEVRSAIETAGQQLHDVRAQGAAVDDMLRAVEWQIAAARRAVRFVELCSTHHTSFRCADVAYANYQSVRVSNDAMTRLALRARASTAPRIGPRRRHQDRSALLDGEATLRATVGTLTAAVQHCLGQVSNLNQRTADLRDTIRDTCGNPGRRWYADLVERRERARAAET